MFRPDRFAVACSTMDHLVETVVCLPLPCQAAQWARMAALIPAFRPRLLLILEQNEQRYYKGVKITTLLEKGVIKENNWRGR